MHGGSTEDAATWHRGGGTDLKVPASRMTRQQRPDSDVCIARVDTRLRRAGGSAGSDLSETASQGAKISLRVHGRRVIVVDESAIEWIAGAGNYVRVHVGAAKHQVRGTLKDVEEVLAGASERFVRVHRSTIINLRSVREFGRTQYGDLIAVLSNGQRLTVGRIYRGKVEALLGTRL
jgi:two-component system LytT family response regulator